ncbi:hypothetical protein [Sulfurovum sp. AR]|uniref:hypothetical protein n=1 Tax=Sulfurovum sp. AR TaxID=1165841 RepID=UPI0006860A30|nr:hypothetical protein [Sulfurovum sp. AR]
MSNKKTFNEWKKYYEAKGISPEIQEQYLTYIKKLLKNNAPIIFNFEHLSLLLGRKTFYLASVVNSPNNHYREFKIKKETLPIIG